MTKTQILINTINLEQAIIKRVGEKYYDEWLNSLGVNLFKTNPVLWLQILNTIRLKLIKNPKDHLIFDLIKANIKQGNFNERK